MNKSNIFPSFFLQTTILINKIISPYLFYYKNLNIFLNTYFLTKKTFLIYLRKMGCYNMIQIHYNYKMKIY